MAHRVLTFVYLHKDRFEAEWNLTSSHRFRSGQDMQYAFAYMHFMASVRRPFNITEEFNELDTDENGSQFALLP